MQGIERKPEPRFLAGIEHHCICGFSLPSYSNCPKTTYPARFLALETARRADYRFLLSMLGAPSVGRSARRRQRTPEGVPFYNA